MYHKLASIVPVGDLILEATFCNGVVKRYDVSPLVARWKAFEALRTVPGLFRSVRVDAGGYGIVWNDELDLSCDELFANGKTIKTPFDGLLAFTDATQLWGLNESTLRKAISYGKLESGVDACKYGKQWVISMEAMVREYGKPKNIA